jgi:hypothetical protein
MFQMKVLPPYAGKHKQSASGLLASKRKLIAACLAYCNPEDGSIMFLENVSEPLQITSHPTTQTIESLLSEHQVACMQNSVL